MPENKRPSIDKLKNQARALVRSDTIPYATALERVAAAHGARDWNTLQAVARRGATAPHWSHVGANVAGRYLGQAFTGRVHEAVAVGGSGAFRLSLALDQPVDVVTFDSFSSLRSRVRATVGADGRTVEVTSDGAPHLVIEGA